MHINLVYYLFPFPETATALPPSSHQGNSVTADIDYLSIDTSINLISSESIVANDVTSPCGNPLVSPRNMDRISNSQFIYNLKF